MTQRFMVPGRLIGLNEYTSANRAGKHVGAQLKGRTEHAIIVAVRGAKIRPMQAPVVILYRWVEPNRKRDKDNIAFARKFIQDALVKCGILKNDGWNHIEGWQDEFAVDRRFPRVEVEICETGETRNGA